MLKPTIMISALLGLALGATDAQARGPGRGKAPVQAEEPARDPAALRRQEAARLLRDSEADERRRQVEPKSRAGATQRSQCQFKSVMTEEDLAKCRTVRR